MTIFAAAGPAQAGISQRITFPPLPDRLGTDAPFAPGATSSSGLPVSYSIVSPAGVAVVNGAGMVSLTGAEGAVTVKASQGGDGTYEAAPPVVRTFVVGAGMQRFVKVAVGPLSYSHSAGIRADGSLWVWGPNFDGQLGDGSTLNRHAPVQVGTAMNWTDVACGATHTVARRADGTLWAWGNNQSGQLGNGTLTNSTVPVQVQTPAGVAPNTVWTKITCAYASTLAIRSDGTLWAWGSNSYNALGVGEGNDRSVAVQVGTASDWVSVSGGVMHAAGLRADGSLWVWGTNFYGNLGTPAWDTSTPVRINPETVWSAVFCGREQTMVIAADGTLWGCGTGLFGQFGNGQQGQLSTLMQLSPDTDWSSVSIGSVCTLALRNDGTLWGTGANFDGELGKGDNVGTLTFTQIGTARDWTAVACSHTHVLALKSSQMLWSWGSNEQGQLGLGTATSDPTPVRVNDSGSWTAVASYDGRTLAIRSDGTLWTFFTGSDTGTQMGSATSWTAVACGAGHALALRTNGTLWAWGGNNYGQVGTGGSSGSVSQPVQVGTATNWTSIACGDEHSLATRADGTLWAWGRNVERQLGNGGNTSLSTPTQIGSVTTWAAVHAAANHSFARRTDGTLWGWGQNNDGVLGVGNTQDRSTPTQTGTATGWSAVACGDNHTLALRTDGTLWGWGSNSSGQVGNGSNDSVYNPVQLGTATDWTQVAAGYRHSMARRTDGSLWSWGLNLNGQTGHSGQLAFRSPAQIPGGAAWGAVVCGNSHTAALRQDGTLWRWGHRGANAQNWTPQRVWPTRSLQLLSFPALPPTWQQGQPLPLNVTLNSGLPPLYTLSGSGTVANDVLTPHTPGPLTITAAAPTDAAWMPVQPFSRTLDILPAPVLVVRGHDVRLANGDTTPDAADDTDFGPIVTPGSYVENRAFTLANEGGAPLTVSNITITGPHAGDFSLMSPTSHTVQPGIGIVMTLSFNPTADGLRQAVVSITNNDGDDALFTFAIQGTGVSQVLTFPEQPGRLTTDAPFALGASSSSGLPVAYTIVSTSGVATVSGGTITLTGAPGSVTVRASQAGNGTHGAAADVYRTFVVGQPNQAFVQVVSGPGGRHSAGIRADGTLWTWGENTNGQLGTGPVNLHQRAPVQVGTATNWRAVACGAGHTLALRADGTLWASGGNHSGEVGNGSNAQVSSLVQVGTSTAWTAISCGAAHSLALRGDGTLWAWGNNASGNLGDGTTTGRNAPVQVGTGNTWAAIAAGAFHTLALRTDGTLWAWGGGSYGQLGTGAHVTAQTTPVQVGTETTWAAVSAGSTHSMALRTDGSVWTWGNNDAGQLGTGTQANRNTPGLTLYLPVCAKVVCGGQHSLAIDLAGNLWRWGSDSAGQLGENDVASPFLASPSQLYLFGPWTSVTAGSEHTLALHTDGTLWAWGGNTHGQLGDGSTTDRADMGQVGTEKGWISVHAGTYQTLARRTDHGLWSWGRNETGELGDGTTVARDRPVQIRPVDSWTAATAGYAYGMAVRTDGTLWTWGSNWDGSLGNNAQYGGGFVHYSPMQMGTATDWLTLATGSGSGRTLGLRTDGSLWAWGSSAADMRPSPPTFTEDPVRLSSAQWSAVACGIFHGLALRADGSLWAAGFNTSGQLGNPDARPFTGFQRIGIATDWTAIATGGEYSLALRADGSLWAWGANSQGQLGIGGGGSADTPTQVSPGTQWKAVACGNMHSVAIRADGSLWGWGLNGHGQLGNGARADIVPSPLRIGQATNWTAVSCGAHHTVALRADGTIWAWGSNELLQAGVENALLPARTWPIRAVQTLTFAPLPPLQVGQPTVLPATASSGLPVTYTILGPATLQGNVLTPTTTGHVTITAYQRGDAAWQEAETMMQTAQVQAAGLTAQQSWRQTHFGTTANTGTAADTFDADQDGLANLVEYAFGLSPVAGSSLQLPVPQRAGNAFTVTFTEPAGVTGVTYGASYSTSLQSGSWTPIPDTGSGTTHTFSAPVGAGDTKVFIQLSVTAAP